MYKCERCGSVINPNRAAERYARSAGINALRGFGECACGELIEIDHMERMLREWNAARVGSNAMAEAFKKARRGAR